MRFQIDHDLHIHSQISLCSKDPEQTPENILAYGEKNGIKTLCLTDHYWDEALPVEDDFFFYTDQNYPFVAKALPLPQGENCRFLFGCETDMDKNFKIGITPAMYDKFDFIIVPTTHLHFTEGFSCDLPQSDTEGRAELYVKRLFALLDSDLPFGKVGLAHPTCELMNHEDKRYLRLLDLISDEVFGSLFRLSAEKGLGIELNMGVEDVTGEDRETILRPYRIAKAEGCKFYLGSDAHHPAGFDGAMARFNAIIDALDLTEDDKFHIAGI